MMGVRLTCGGLLWFALAGCGQVGPPLKTPCAPRRLVLRIQLEPSVEAVDHARRAIKGAPVAASRALLYRGFEYELSDGSAVVVLPELRGQGDAEYLRIWGHELAHVACGPWHDKPEK
jgi:hypothetical protein